MTAGDADRQLRQIERDGVAAGLVMAGLGGVLVLVAGHGLRDAGAASAGVIAGGLLMAFSYRAIKGAVDVLVASMAALPPGDAPPADDRPPEEVPRGEEPVPDPPRRPALSAGRRILLSVKFFTRYALLALAAYVMLTCFRLPPVSVLAGAMSPFLAALTQVGRMSRARARRSHP